MGEDFYEFMLPTYKILGREEIGRLRRVLVEINREKLNAACKELWGLLDTEDLKNIYSLSLFNSKEGSYLVIIYNIAIKSRLESLLRRLSEEGSILRYYTIESIDRILPTKKVIFFDENLTKLRIYPLYAFVGIFAEIAKILGTQADFVIERLGYYYGRSYVKYLMDNKVIDRPELVKSILYSVITGTSLGLYSLIDLQAKAGPFSTTLTIKVRGYYEEEGYAKMGIRRCGLYEIGFFKGIIEYCLREAGVEKMEYKVTEPVCYDERGERVFVIEVPVKISKEELSTLKKIKESLRRASPYSMYALGPGFRYYVQRAPQGCDMASPQYYHAIDF